MSRAAMRREFSAGVDALVKRLLKGTRVVPLRRARHVFERLYIEYAIAHSGGDRRKAAKALGIGFSTLKEKLRYPTK